MRRKTQAYPNGDLALVIDCADVERAADFWTLAIGYVRGCDRVGRYLHLAPASGPGIEILLQEVPDHKRVKNRLHLDLRARDLEREVDRLVRLGARRSSATAIREAGWRWHVLTDPDGNEFCVLEPADGYWG